MRLIPTSASGTDVTAAPRSRAVRAGIAALAVLFALLAVPAGAATADDELDAPADVQFNQHMLGLVNRDRLANGLKALVADATMGATAEDALYDGCGFPVYGRAKDMGVRNYFSHTILGCPTKSVFHILTSTGLVYSGGAENIAWMSGTTDPVIAAENLHGQLMGSSGHRTNILNPNHTKIGIGSWRSSPGQTWSGGGYALTNVFIVAEIFAGGPVDPVVTDPAGRYTPLTPARILDTRDGTGAAALPVGPGGTIDIQVTGRGGVPSTDVSAVAMTVTIVQPSAAGYVTLYPAGITRPLAANMNFVPGEMVSNLVVVKVGAGGKVSLFNPAGTTHVIADVAGWYSVSGTGNAGRFESVVPSRILDTRTGLGGGTRLGPGASLELQVAGRGGVPATGAQAASVNIAVTAATGVGFLTVHPTGEARPFASTLTFTPGVTAASRAAVKLGAGGKVTIYNGGDYADVIVDLGGWYTDASVTGTKGALTPVTPARILDTRDGTGGIPGPLATSQTVDVQITGRGGVPASGGRAVVLNATVTQPAAPGYLTIFPAGASRPLASDLNYNTGDTRANLVVVQVGSNGRISLFAAAGTQVIFDVAGWMS
jgi:uncharacterized protein YkwD